MTGQRKRYIPDNAYWENIRARWSAALQTMVAEGRLVPALEFLARRNLTAEQVQIAESEARIFSFGDASGETYYPAFFCNPGLVEMSELVSQRLVGKSGFDKWIFFSNDTHRLDGRTPLKALEDGDLELVLQMADDQQHRKIRRGAALASPSTT